MPFKGWKGLRLDTSPAGLQRRTCLDISVTPSGLLSDTNFDIMCSECGDRRGDIVYRLMWIPPYGLRAICSSCCCTTTASESLRGCSAAEEPPRRETCRPGQKDSTETGTVSSMRPSKSSETTSSH